MKTHNLELMLATYDKNASGTDRAAQVQTLMDNIREDGDTDVKLKRSVIAKLASTKDKDGVSIYKRASKSSNKSGKPVKQKIDIVKTLANMVGCEASLIESFSNATKPSLEAFTTALVAAMPKEETEADNVPTAEA